MTGAPLEGCRFGRLTVLGPGREQVDLDSRRRRYWRTRCDCGAEGLVLEENLLSGRSRSCGCRGFRDRTGTEPERLSPDLGSALRLARKKAGISQQALARCSGLSRQSIVSYEQGRVLPSLPSLLRLTEALRIGPEEYLGKEAREDDSDPR